MNNDIEYDLLNEGFWDRFKNVFVLTPEQKTRLNMVYSTSGLINDFLEDAEVYRCYCRGRKFYNKAFIKRNANVMTVYVKVDSDVGYTENDSYSTGDDEFTWGSSRNYDEVAKVYYKAYSVINKAKNELSDAISELLNETVIKIEVTKITKEEFGIYVTFKSPMNYEAPIVR